jgi:multidrug resistance efflux pump
MAGVGLLATALLGSLGLSATQVSGDVEQTRALLNGIEFGGMIEPRQKFAVTSPSGGVVRRVLVEVGDRVVAGQPLVEVDNASLTDALSAAEAEYKVVAAEVTYREKTVAALDQSLNEIATALTRSNGAVALAQRAAEQVPGRQLRDSPERAQAALDQAASKLQRTRRLHEQGLVSDEALEDQLIAVRIAQNDLDNARQWQVAAADLRNAQQEQARQQLARSRAEFQQQRIDQLALLAQAESRAAQARQRVDVAARAVDESLVKAHAGGVVVDVTTKPGDRPGAGAALLALAQLEQMMVDVPVAPQLVNVLRPGQQATVILPTLPAERVTGRIATINPMPSPNMTHRVEVHFNNGERRLFSGQPAQVIFHR